MSRGRDKTGADHVYIYIIAGFAFTSSASERRSKSRLAELLRRALGSVAPELIDMPIVLDRPKQASHGDFASNLALQLAKPLRETCAIWRRCCWPSCPPLVVKAEVAGAGFIINFPRLPVTAKTDIVSRVLAETESTSAAPARGPPGTGRVRLGQPHRPASAMGVAQPFMRRCPMCSILRASR